MAIQTVTVKIDGAIYSLTYNTSLGTYEATISAPPKSSYTNNDGHYYPVEITAVDDAGNSLTIDDSHATLGNSLKLKVKEKIKPTALITVPTADATMTNNKPVIAAQLRDTDSGIDPSSIILKVDNEAVTVGNLTKTAIEGGYDISYTPGVAFGDGSHIISLQVSDFDGNQCNAVTSSFKVDTVPPILSVTSPTANLVTNTAALIVAGITNDETSSPVAIQIKLNHIDQGVVNVNGTTGAYSKSVVLIEGGNTIEVTATDGAGKTTTITRMVTLNTTVPVFHGVTIAPNPVDCGMTYKISVDVRDE